MENKSLFIIGGLTVLLLFGLIIMTNTGKKINPNGEVKVITDKEEYNKEEVLRVKIENASKRKICFSSCYPYYFEKKNDSKNDGWESYKYSECQNVDLVEKCVAPEDLKAFQLNVPPVKKGTHRLAIPVCFGCRTKEEFKEDKWFYSNEFTIR